MVPLDQGNCILGPQTMVPVVIVPYTQGARSFGPPRPGSPYFWSPRPWCPQFWSPQTREPVVLVPQTMVPVVLVPQTRELVQFWSPRPGSPQFWSPRPGSSQFWTPTWTTCCRRFDLDCWLSCVVTSHVPIPVRRFRILRTQVFKNFWFRLNPGFDSSGPGDVDCRRRFQDEDCQHKLEVCTEAPSSRSWVRTKYVFNKFAKHKI